MSDFAAGFSAGSSAGNAIQQRILAKKLQELENTRYEEEKAYNRGLDTDTAAFREREFAALEADRKANREAVAKRLNMSERELSRREAIARTMQGSEIMSQFGAAMNAGLDARKRRAEIGLLEARQKKLETGGDSSGWTTTEEIDPETGEVRSVRRTSRGNGPIPSSAPSARGQEQLSPESQEIANSIAALQTQIGKHKVAMAGGDMRTGFLGMGGSRQSQIDEANAKIARLRAMQGGGAPQAQPGAPAPAIDAEMQRRGFVKGPDGKWIKPAQ